MDIRRATRLDEQADRHIQHMWPTFIQQLPFCKTPFGWQVGDLLYSILMKADKQQAQQQFNLKPEAFPEPQL
jgi:hypothetical protein